MYHKQLVRQMKDMMKIIFKVGWVLPSHSPLYSEDVSICKQADFENPCFSKCSVVSMTLHWETQIEDELPCWGGLVLRWSSAEELRDLGSGIWDSNSWVCEVLRLGSGEVHWPLVGGTRGVGLSSTEWRPPTTPRGFYKGHWPEAEASVVVK